MNILNIAIQQVHLTEIPLTVAIIGAAAIIIVSIISSVFSLIAIAKNRKLLTELELLKNKFQKETISYQILITEQTKRRFNKLELLHENLIEYAFYQRYKLSTDFNLVENSEDLIKESNKLLSQAIFSFRKSKLYLTKETINSIEMLLNNCEKTTESLLLRKLSEDEFSKYTIEMIDYALKIEPLISDLEKNIKSNLHEMN